MQQQSNHFIDKQRQQQNDDSADWEYQLLSDPNQCLNLYL